jgi:hypothetical protein
MSLKYVYELVVVEYVVVVTVDEPVVCVLAEFTIIGGVMSVVPDSTGRPAVEPYWIGYHVEPSVEPTI